MLRVKVQFFELEQFKRLLFIIHKLRVVLGDELVNLLMVSNGWVALFNGWNNIWRFLYFGEFLQFGPEFFWISFEEWFHFSAFFSNVGGFREGPWELVVVDFPVLKRLCDICDRVPLVRACPFGSVTLDDVSQAEVKDITMPLLYLNLELGLKICDFEVRLRKEWTLIGQRLLSAQVNR